MPSPRSRTGWRGAALPFSRLLALTYPAAAVAPVLLLAVLLVFQLGAALERDATERAGRALEAVEIVLADAERTLDDLARSYAGWPAFASRLADGDLEPIRRDILQFLVDRGAVDGARVERGRLSADSGDPELWSRLRQAMAAAPLPPAARIDQTRPLTAGDEVYLVAEHAVRDDTGTIIGQLLLVQRLDARFVADLRHLTGFEVAVLDAQGRVATATSPLLASATDGAAVGGVRLSDGLVTGVRILSSPGPTAGTSVHVGSVVVVSRLGALQTAIADLPALLLGLVLATIVVAGTLAVLIAHVLNRRLQFLHVSLAAVADGRVPPSRPTTNDELDRVADGLDRLVSTLDRRESFIRRGLAKLGAVRSDAPLDLVRYEVAHALCSTIGATSIRLSADDGTTLVEVVPEEPGSGQVAGSSRSVTAALRLDSGPLVTAILADDAVWTEGDTAMLEVISLVAGTILRDAEQFQRIAKRAAKLDRINQVQRGFLRGVSHNLRSPLATIELAAADLVDTDDQYTQARAIAIRRQGHRLTRLVDQVLWLSRLDAGMVEVTADPVALGPLARRVVREMGLEGRASIADRSQGSVAVADEALAEQVVWVLLDNAATYASGGGISIEIDVASPTAGEDPMVVVAVEDEGPGIPPSERRRIFQRFVRGSTSAGHPGSGLGLALARSLARLMDGDLVVAPAHRGARLEFMLPAARAARQPMARSATLREA